MSANFLTLSSWFCRLISFCPFERLLSPVLKNNYFNTLQQSQICYKECSSDENCLRIEALCSHFLLIQIQRQRTIIKYYNCQYLSILFTPETFDDIPLIHTCADALSFCACDY